MSKAICIMGESGSGKTTACRNLDPATTYYIDADGKGLSWRGWRKQYNTAARNYAVTDDPAAVYATLHNISEKAPHIKVIVVDTLNGIMVGEEMRRIREKSYDKWMDLAVSVWGIVSGAYRYREDLALIFLAHSQTERDENGYQFTRIKTSGRKLDKLCLESKLTVVLRAKCVNGRYVLETHNNNSTVKTPLGMFDAPEIDNDVNLILKALEEY